MAMTFADCQEDESPTLTYLPTGDYRTIVACDKNLGYVLWKQYNTKAQCESRTAAAGYVFMAEGGCYQVDSIYYKVS